MSQKSKAALLVALIVIAAGVFYRNSQGPAGPGKVADFRKTFTPLPVENPELQRWKILETRNTEYKSSGRDLFSESLPPAPVVKPKPQPVLDPTPAPAPPPPPPSLPANMKFYGWGVVPNGTARRAFLTDGEEVFIVGEGDTLLGRYRILRIGNGNLEFEEIESGRRNSAPLEEQAAPPA